MNEASTTYDPNDSPQLPPDGSQVVAETYPSDEYERPAQRVSGQLTTRPVPALGYIQCWVNGVQVDPATVSLTNT